MTSRLSVFLAFLLLLAFSASTLASGGEIILREGTPVTLRLTEEVSSANKRPGADVALAVALDVEVDGYVVIASQTPAHGTVSWAEASGRVGKSGKVQISVDATKAADSRRVSLRSTVARAGEDSETSSVALGVVCCPLFLLMRGDEAVYPIGTELKAYVAQDMKFPVSALARPQ